MSQKNYSKTIIDMLLAEKEEYKRKSDHYTQTDLIKERGWTRTAIKRFLGEPDLIKPNTYYKSAAPMNLYLKERVHKTELTDEYREYIASVAKKREALKESVEQRRNQLLEEIKKLIEKIKINVKTIPYRDIILKAIKGYNDHKQSTGEMWDLDRFATINSDMDFLIRISKNYIRHNLTKYDEYLYELAMNTSRRVGRGEASEFGYQIIQDKIYDAINRAYPNLEENLEKTILDLRI